MSYVPTGEITRHRLHSWTAKLGLEDATPLVLLGVGHNRNSGTMVICTCEEDEQFPDEMLAAMLIGAAKELMKGKKITAIRISV